MTVALNTVRNRVVAERAQEVAPPDRAGDERQADQRQTTRRAARRERCRTCNHTSAKLVPRRNHASSPSASSETIAVRKFILGGEPTIYQAPRARRPVLLRTVASVVSAR